MGLIKSEEDKAELTALFTLAFLKICSLLRQDEKNKKNENSSVAVIPPSDENATLVKALNYIGKNSARMLTFTELAASTGLSPRQLQRIFRARMEQTFSEILNTYRISHAKEMMHEGRDKYSLSEIALKCGFQNYVSFWTQFKKKRKNSV